MRVRMWGGEELDWKWVQGETVQPIGTDGSLTLSGIVSEYEKSCITGPESRSAENGEGICAGQ